jgi:hypothetical protein
LTPYFAELGHDGWRLHYGYQHRKKVCPPDAVNYFSNKALAVDCVLFMMSALLSFLSIRLDKTTQVLERFAEIIFILGLVSITIIAVIFSFEII